MKEINDLENSIEFNEEFNTKFLVKSGEIKLTMPAAIIISNQTVIMKALKKILEKEQA